MTKMHEHGRHRHARGRLNCNCFTGFSTASDSLRRHCRRVLTAIDELGYDPSRRAHTKYAHRSALIAKPELTNPPSHPSHTTSRRMLPRAGGIALILVRRHLSDVRFDHLPSPIEHRERISFSSRPT